MALRIADVIQHGWIDNTTPGITKGELYILGHNDPIKLFLKGNCWRDVAGTKMEFRNTDPILDEETIAAIHYLQKGVVGDITASMKRKIPTIGVDLFEEYYAERKEIPFEWKNAIYIEWFSMANGRIVIESTNFHVTLTEHKWEMSETAESKQRLHNNQAMNQFMHLTLGMLDAEAEVDFEAQDEADEYEWEKRLRLRDHLEEASWFLERETDIEEAEVKKNSAPIADRHVLVQLAHHVHDIVVKQLGNAILDDGPRSGLANAIGYIFDAADDAWPAEDLPIENGYRLAVLKRALEACNHAVAYCNTLILEDESYEETRTEIHHLRGCILDTIRHIRSSEAKNNP